MRIDCTFCGVRDQGEFTYLGDANPCRPVSSDDSSVDIKSVEKAAQDMFEYVYLRDNPAGRHRELWYHGAGCRSWLVVTRDVRSHEIFAVTAAAGADAGAANGGER